MPDLAGKPTVWLETFGCQMNALDSELVLGRLLREGYVRCADRERADVILYNTCSVRDHAEQRVNSNVGALRALKRRRPGLVIGILGCQAQREGAAILDRLPHVDLVVGTQQYPRLPDLLRQAREGRRWQVATEMADGGLLEPEHTALGRARPFQAFVKVTEGCNCACAFCIVPTTRGREVSRPPEAIREEMARLAADGVREVTLLGQNITSYGNDLRPRVTLAQLLGAVHDVAGLDRIRFVTGHPAFVNRDLLEAVRDLPKICEYLHIPAQAGSNRVLKAMRRGYTVERYREICAQAKELIPGVEIAGDFIVGFPGETEEDFEATACLMREVEFGTAYVFKYSPRPGTPADAFPDDVPAEVKKRRNNALLAIQSDVQLLKNRALVGTEVDVLVEGEAARPLRTGRSGLQAAIPGGSGLPPASAESRDRKVAPTVGAGFRPRQAGESRDPSTALGAGPKVAPTNGKVRTWTGRTRTHRIAVFNAGRDLSGQLVKVRVNHATALTLVGELV